MRRRSRRGNYLSFQLAVRPHLDAVIYLPQNENVHELAIMVWLYAARIQGPRQRQMTCGGSTASDQPCAQRACHGQKSGGRTISYPGYGRALKAGMPYRRLYRSRVVVEGAISPARLMGEVQPLGRRSESFVTCR